MHTIGFLSPPGPLSGDETAFWIFTGAMAVLVAASVALAVKETLRLRSALPLVVFLSAALWLPNEPFIDAILGFQYASDAPLKLFTLWDREIPPGVLGVGAMFFIFPWAIYRMVLSGTSTRTIVGVLFVAGVLDWIAEWPALHYGLFEYYGDNPSRILGLPLTSMVQNTYLYALMAAVLLLVTPRLTGRRSLLFLPVIPGLYLGVATLCTWPAYLALHAGWPTEVFLPLSVLSAAMNVYIPIVLLDIARDVARPAVSSIPLRTPRSRGPTAC